MCVIQQELGSRMNRCWKEFELKSEWPVENNYSAAVWSYGLNQPE